MVKVRETLPTTEGGDVDLLAWCDRLCDDHEHLIHADLQRATTALADEHPDLLVVGLELAELVADLNMDQSAVLAGLVYRGVRLQRLDDAQLLDWVGEDATSISRAVAAMATTSLLEMSNSPLLEKEHQDQVENIKRMLVALIDDARVAVVKLAERVMVLRHAKHYSQARRTRIAQEARAVFAPLAGRLGIWQLKWELEDLALRYTQEEAYQEIAKQLRGKREEREKQVNHMVDQVRGLLRGHGIDAAIYGRAKHIYSIWRKIRNKGVNFDQVYDVRAVRVVVDTLAECYAALGILHTTWPHIPSEFDDYIANPKENGYQSIHTAVTAADGKTLEIQIRTKAMHEDAELGVCAHWSYKEGAVQDRQYDAKMDWLRQVMEWHEDLGGNEPISALLQHRISEERIFVSTPKGHVLELPVGATVLDFAYRVHTDVGNACRRATVNGIPARLSDVLETGQQVSVVAEDSEGPVRQWLEPGLNFVHTDRAKAKLSSYFRSLPEDEKVALGQTLFSQSLSALGIPAQVDQSMLDLVEQLGKNSVNEVFCALGSGELTLVAVLTPVLMHVGNGDQLGLPGIESKLPVSVRFKIEGRNRDGLLHDITQVIADMGLALSATTGRVSNPDAHAIITVDVELNDWSQMVLFISHLGLVDGVSEVQRLAL